MAKGSNVALFATGERDCLASRRSAPPRFARSLASADGEILLFSMGTNLMAVDPRESGPKEAARLLWIQDMADPNADSPDRSLPRVDIVLPWQFENQAGRAEDRWHVFGPVSGHYVCFRRLGDLVAADPRNGKTLWVRRNLPQDCVVFGDDRYVFVLAAHRDEAMVLRASNGELVGTRKMPPIADKRAGDSCLAIVGQKDFAVADAERRLRVELVRPAGGPQLWPERKFAAGALARLIDEKAVGVMEPGGRFALYSLPDGRTIAELKLEAEAALRDITLLESGGNYLLLTSESEPERTRSSCRAAFKCQAAISGGPSARPSQSMKAGCTLLTGTGSCCGRSP